jgi:hypothetical protein
MHDDNAHFDVLERMNTANGGDVTALVDTLTERNNQFFDKQTKESHYPWLATYDNAEHIRLCNAIATVVQSKATDEDKE